MNNEDSSYSIRDNGHIWKYAKQQSGAWRRVIDWSPLVLRQWLMPQALKLSRRETTREHPWSPTAS